RQPLLGLRLAQFGCRQHADADGVRCLEAEDEAHRDRQERHYQHAPWVAEQVEQLRFEDGAHQTLLCLGKTVTAAINRAAPTTSRRTRFTPHWSNAAPPARSRKASNAAPLGSQRPMAASAGAVW